MDDEPGKVRGMVMKIKDVEKLTGLTAKSIRYYESKGLLQVERDEGNSYRSYTEGNVRELRKIRLLRFLDFSIEEIREIKQMDTAKIKKVLLEKMESLENQSQNLEIKRDLCRTLSKDGISNDAVVEKYNEMFDALDEEWSDWRNSCFFRPGFVAVSQYSQPGMVCFDVECFACRLFYGRYYMDMDELSAK